MANRERIENCKASSGPEKPEDDEMKSRRSSILKPQKPRNPLGDLDLGIDDTQDGDTATLSRTATSRRVSFAPSNFVKQFAQDPEKNTIWDSTYEESIEKLSDYSPAPGPVEASVLREEDMDITLVKENVRIVSSPNMLNLIENKENLVNNMELTLIASQKVQSVSRTICCNSSIVSDTKIISNRLVCDVNLPDVNSEAAQMEFTEILPVLHQNNVICDENSQMELTLTNRTLYFNTSIKNDSNAMKTLASNMKNTVTANDNSMEFTEALQLIKSNEAEAIKLNFMSENNCHVSSAKENYKTDVSKNVSVQITTSNTENLTISEAIKSVKPPQDVSIVTEQQDTCKSITQTPLSSFHASLGEYPSCDDTQHLINYNLGTKNQPKSDFSKIIADEYDPTFLNSKYLPLDINSESFRVSLNTIGSSSKRPDDADTKDGAGHFGDLPENTSNAAKLKSGASVIDLVSISERSGANISQTDASLASRCSENSKDLSADSFTISFWDELITPELRKVNYESAVETVKKNLAYKKRVCQIIEKKFEELQAHLVKQNRENEEESERMSWESDSSTDVSINFAHCSRRLSYLNFLPEKEPDEILPLKEKVKQLCKRYDSYWDIASLEDGVYKFGALCETVGLTVKLNEDTGEVLHTEIVDVTGQYEPIVIYLRNVFMERLSSSSLCSALGGKFDVLSFLDFLEITIQKIANMKKDFDRLVLTYAVTVDSNFGVRFTAVSIKLEQIWEFCINIYDLDNMCEKSVNVNVKMGHLSKSNIRKCLEGCPKGFNFIGVFIQNVYSMLHSQEQKIL